MGCIEVTKLTPKQQKVADFVCDEIANGRSLRSIARDNEDVNERSVFTWLAKSVEFQQQYARAREDQADSIFDEILDIVDNTKNDVQDRRLQMDARKWMAGKLRPKKYGDKLDIGGNVAITIGKDDSNL
jgi:Skp family chaperone for outer membrane proteins